MSFIFFETKPNGQKMRCFIQETFLPHRNLRLLNVHINVMRLFHISIPMSRVKMLVCNLESNKNMN
jgi:hypothetical protein